MPHYAGRLSLLNLTEDQKQVILETLANAGWERWHTGSDVIATAQRGDDDVAQSEWSSLKEQFEQHGVLAEAAPTRVPDIGIPALYRIATDREMMPVWGRVLDGAPSGVPTSPPTPPGTPPAPPPSGAGTGPIDAVQLLNAAVQACTLPDAVWNSLDESQRRSFAETLIQEAWRERLAYVDRTSWLLAPELVLLRRSPESDREQLAAEILKVRVGLAPHQVELAQQETELKKVSADQRRVAVDMLKELVEHMKKWRRLAALGAAMLVLVTLFGMAMVGWLVQMAADKQVTVWALPAVIFVLALFAASPAVLLLLERPLQGIDKWMPGGEAGDEEKEPAETPQQPTPAAPAPPAEAAGSKPKTGEAT